MLSLEQRLWGGLNRVEWSPSDIERIHRAFGVGFASLLDAPRRREVTSSLSSLPSPTSTKADDGKTVSFTISTSSVDRAGDTINVHGWKTAAFSRNPVALWGHDSSMAPIGKATRLWRDGHALKATVNFASSDWGQNVKALVKEKMVNASSVGFRPIKWEFSREKGREGG